MWYIFSDFSDKGVEGVVDAHAGLGRRFDEWNAVVLGRFPGLCHVNSSRRQIALVSHHFQLQTKQLLLHISFQSNQRNNTNIIFHREGGKGHYSL